MRATKYDLEACLQVEASVLEAIEPYSAWVAVSALLKLAAQQTIERGPLDMTAERFGALARDMYALVAKRAYAVRAYDA